MDTETFMNTETFIGSLYVISILLNMVYISIAIKVATQIGEKIKEDDIFATLFIIFMPIINSVVALWLTMALINSSKEP
ncbi:MAG: hypothetical protein COA78_11950 [Blastopirellula sp.]|nr:MAG: hypothetical protein COA78_11950 [Blastopirellula sp.]